MQSKLVFSNDAKTILDESRKFTDRDNTSLGEGTEYNKNRKLAHNNGMFCEVERIEKFRFLMKTMSQENNFSDTVKALLQNVASIINCKEASLFVLHSHETVSNCKELMVQRTLLENKYIDLICLETNNPVNPQFQKLHEA